MDDGCHQDREGVGHEVADPEEVWWSLEVMMGCWMPGESCGNRPGKATKNSEPLDGRPETHGEN